MFLDDERGHNEKLVLLLAVVPDTVVPSTSSRDLLLLLRMLPGTYQVTASNPVLFESECYGKSKRCLCDLRNPVG